MASSRITGPIGRESQLPWAKRIDDGTMCRQMSPLPGVVNGPTIRQARCPFECRIEAETYDPGVFSELVIIEGKEWVKFLAAVGANAASPIKDTVTDLYVTLKKLGLKGKASIRVIKGREYVVISGHPGLRKFLNAPKYTATNVKVADLVIGTARLGKSAVKGTALSVVLVSAADVLEAILDDKNLLEKELGFTILADVSKAAIGSIAGFIGGATLAVMGAPVVWPIAAGIVIGIFVGQVLDSQYPTDEIVKAMSAYYNNLTESIMMRGARLLQQLEREILWQIWPHEQIPFPY